MTSTPPSTPRSTPPSAPPPPLERATSTTAGPADRLDRSGPTARRTRPGAQPSRGPGIRGRQGRAGWAFVSPQVALLLVFLVAPIFMALWVSMSDWRGQGSPFSSSVGFVGLDNYARLFTEQGLVRTDFMTSLRNTFYYTVLVVPLQTCLALLLAVVLNQGLRARGFFRSAFYFPSVTSSVAVSLVFLFLFTSNGAVNAILRSVGLDPPTWFADPRGVLHLLGDAVGVWDSTSPPAALTDASLGGLTAWQWLAGPSVAMSAIILLVVWTTTGTFMLMYLAALQDLSVDVDEAATVDGVSAWQRFRYVTLPQLRSTTLLVTTLGFIGSWQVFDQIYVMSQGAPAKTTLSPAYLSFAYTQQNLWGVAAAMAFVLFAIIVTLTTTQRVLLRDKDAQRQRRLERRARKAGGAR